MPLVKITISNLGSIDTAKILKETSRIAGEETGKGESKLMVLITEGIFMMRGMSAVCAFVDMRGIGKVEKLINEKISKRVSQLLTAEANIPPENIYLNFTDMPRENWGHSEGVF